MDTPIENAVETGLISAPALAGLLKSSGTPIALLDASYGAGFGGHPPRSVFEALRIGNAQYFDIDEIADPDAPFAHTLPDANLFAQAVGALGISNDHLVVIYDQTGIAMAAARAWWMFRVFGHTRVCVLDGGLPAWRNAGFEINEDSVITPVPQVFSASLTNHHVSSHARVLAATQEEDTLIIDTRPSVGSGRIPRSHHLPAGLLLDAATLGLAQPDQLQSALAPYALTPSSRIITSCGSGVMACVLALALHRLGHQDYSVYDGSWTEWSSKEFPS